jgi:hypothetical protein
MESQPIKRDKDVFKKTPEEKEALKKAKKEYKQFILKQSGGKA